MQDAGLDVRRGLKGAVFAGLGGFSVAMLIVGVAKLCDYLKFDPFDSFWRAGWQEWRYWFPVVIVCSSFMAAAGWATYAPNGQHRFAATLAKIIAVWLAIWLPLGVMELLPQHIKGEDPLTPVFASMQAFAVQLALTTFALTCIRAPSLLTSPSMQSAGWDTRRGMKGALLSALGGFSAAMLVVGMAKLFNYLQFDPFDIFRGVEWRHWRYWLPTVLGCTVVVAAAGWANYAPRGRYRFAATLAIIIVAGIAILTILGPLLPDPRHFKNVHPPSINPNAWISFTVPTFVVAFVVSWVRARFVSSNAPAQDSLGELPTANS